MKKRYSLILGFILLFSFILNVNASTTTYDRNNASDYGVNKKWKINNSNKNKVLNTPLVNADEKIYDFSNILTDNEETYFKDKIDSFISKSGIDVVILTVNLPYSNDKTNEDYAADFYDYNDFGIDNELYSGILLLRNTYESDPYFNIYTFGNAQLYFSYDRCENILDSIYFNFKTANYYDGLNIFMNKLNAYYDMGIPDEMESYYVDSMGYLHQRFIYPWFACFMVASIGTAIIIITLVRKNKMIRKAVKASDYLDKESINYTVRQDMLIGSRTTHYTISSSSGSGHSGGGSFHSSSGSSGGGHSSGGGRHG